MKRSKRCPDSLYEGLGSAANAHIRDASIVKFSKRVHETCKRLIDVCKNMTTNNKMRTGLSVCFCPLFNSLGMLDETAMYFTLSFSLQ